MCVHRLSLAYLSNLKPHLQIGRNNNKFYYCQLLERDSAPYTYAVFCRWGRVGDRGQTKMYEQGVSLPVAMAVGLGHNHPVCACADISSRPLTNR
jgi:WGR domain